jgi:O-methyltransferase
LAILESSKTGVFELEGPKLTGRYAGKGYPPDFEPLHKEIFEAVQEYTMTSPERVQALVEAVRYVIRNEIGGAFVECGVYMGGSMMAVAMTLLKLQVTDRNLYLFDTFEGMPRPGAEDVNFQGRPAIKYFMTQRIDDSSSRWANAPLDVVREAMRLTGYSENNIHFIKGLVEDTVPAKAPEKIALLRLDTDWYKSTKHEMEYLFPRVSSAGAVIIDDYGELMGAKKAVDEYLKEQDIRSFLHRIDFASRLIIKDEGRGILRQ